jgi:ribose transport system permease protein
VTYNPGQRQVASETAASQEAKAADDPPNGHKNQPVQRQDTDSGRRDSGSRTRGLIGVQVRKPQIQRHFANIAVIIVLGLYVQFKTHAFLLTGNLEALSVEIVVVTIIALPMTMIMICGEIDLSVSGVVALTGVVSASLMRDGHPLWVAMLAAIAVGALVGVVNSILRLLLGINSMIATIGTLYVSLGVAQLITNGIPVTSVPASFGLLGAGSFLGMPVAVTIIVLGLALFMFVQHSTLFGKYIVAVGSNEEAAFDNGINVGVVKTAMFVIVGAVAGFAGVVYASRVGSAYPALDDNLLFSVIVASVIGGTSLAGGSGSVFGAFLGSLVIGVIDNGLNIIGISEFWQEIALGIVLVAAVSLDGEGRRRIVAKTKQARRVIAARRELTELELAEPPSEIMSAVSKRKAL